ncbi:MAG: glycosyltransferase family 4 protein [Pseudomonadota bacterium]
MLRVLVFSTLYPNQAQPNHGVFVENRLRHTLAQGGIEATVLAPVPWFPFRHPRFGRYATYAAVPRLETRHGLEIHHPRYPVIPKIGSRFTPVFLYRAAKRVLDRMAKQGAPKFDLIDAHYFYPDGVAAARLARELDIPLLITGRGTDLTLIPQSPPERAQIQWAGKQASALITVCEDLRHRLVELGEAPSRVVTLRNGVDLARFSPGDRNAARKRLGLDGFTLLSVGSLIPRKGHELIIAALADLPDARLLIAGSGPMRAELERVAEEKGVASRVRFLGEIAHDALTDAYRAADIFVLASSREGWANVLLEAMACGTPVVATNVNGTPEVVQDPKLGALVQERSAPALAQAIKQLRALSPDRRAVRTYAEQFSWDDTARANKALFLAAAHYGFQDRFNPAIVTAACDILGHTERLPAFGQ